MDNINNKNKYRTPAPSISSSSSSSSTSTAKNMNNKSEKAPLRQLEVQMENNNYKNLSAMMGKPEIFTGDKRDEKALLWVRQMERLKKAMRMEDDVMLAIVGSNFRGKAEEWWCTREDSIVTWTQFVSEFKNNFAPTELQNTMWWNELDSVQQRDGETVDTVKVKMERLCNNLGLDKDNELIIRKFYKALRKDIQYELDRDNILFRQWDEITIEARRIEMVHKKHGIVEAAYINNVITPIAGSTTTQHQTITPSNSASNNHNHAVAQHSITNENSLLSTTLQHLCDNLASLKITVDEMKSDVRYKNSGYQGNSNNGYYQKNYGGGVNGNGGNRYNNNGPIRCFTCGGENHKSFECPNKHMMQGQNNFSNSNNMGKEVGQQ